MADEGFEAYHVPQQSRRDKLREQLIVAQNQPLLQAFYDSSLMNLSSSSSSNSSSLSLSHSHSNHAYFDPHGFPTNPSSTIQVFGNNPFLYQPQNVQNLNQNQNMVFKPEALSLSLSSTQRSMIPFQGVVVGGGTSGSVPFTGYASVLKDSRFLKAAMELLEEMCDVGVSGIFGEKVMVVADASLMEPPLERSLSEDPVVVGDGSDGRNNKSRLLTMLDEISFFSLSLLHGYFVKLCFKPQNPIIPAINNNNNKSGIPPLHKNNISCSCNCIIPNNPSYPLLNPKKTKTFSHKTSLPFTSSSNTSPLKPIFHNNPVTGYAAAIINVSQNTNSLLSVQRDVNILLKFLQSNGIEQGQALKKVVEHGNFNRHVIALVKMLVKKNKVGIVKEVLEEFERIYDELCKTQVVLVSSATKMGEDQLFGIAKSVQQLSGAARVKVKNLVQQRLPSETLLLKKSFEMKKCELCKLSTRTFCDSDQASLCWDCDSKVHGANFLVERHTRTLLCHACQSQTPWKASGAKLGNTLSLYEICAGETKIEDQQDQEESEGDNDDSIDTDDEDEEDDEEDEDDEVDDEDGDNQVYRRYRQYYQQMQAVVTSFEYVSGLNNAAPYASLAIKSMSKHFKCLKKAITDQIQFTNKAHFHISNRKDGSPRFGNNERGGPYRQQQQPVWQPQRGLPDRAVTVLRAWLFEHFLHPYPTDTDKIMLAKQTGLSRSQVSNWFINARVRLWKPMVEEIHTLETKQAPNNEHSRNKSSDHFPSETSLVSETPSTSLVPSIPIRSQQLNLPQQIGVGMNMGGASSNTNSIKNNNSVSLTLGLYQNHGIGLAEQTFPLSAAQRYGLALETTNNEGYVMSGFESQNRHFGRDVNIGGQMFHDFVG